MPIMEKRNIVIFTNTLLSGGAEKQALLLATYLKTIHQIYLVVYYGDKVEEKFRQIIEHNHIQVVYLSGNHAAKAFSLYRFLKKNRIQIIFSYLLTTNFIGALIGKLAGVPYRVGGIRNAVLDEKKLPIQRFINNNLSTHTIFNNYRGLALLKKRGFKPDRSLVIPNCFELNTDHLQRPASMPIKIITVGRFVQQKGYAEALKAMRILKDKSVDFKYFIVGYGPLENEIKGQIIQLELGENVEVVINPTNINDYYIQSDIYLCSSYFEGLSNTVMEALSFSLPIVATDVGDNDKLIEEGKNGFLVPESEAALFVDPLIQLINSKDLRDEMGLHSYQIIKNNYSAEAFKKRYEEFINSVLPYG